MGATRLGSEIDGSVQVSPKLGTQQAVEVGELADLEVQVPARIVDAGGERHLAVGVRALPFPAPN